MEGVTDNPSDLCCLHCKTPIPKRMVMANSHGGQLHKGMIMICSNCTGAMVLGDTAWRPMTEADFKALPPKSQEYLVATVRGLEARLKAGAEWNPYQKVQSRN